MSYLSKIFSGVLAAIWAIALVGLPLTSYPPYYEFTNAIVAPFSALPVLLLILFWLLPHLWRRNALPSESKILFVFLLWTVIASAVAFFIQIPTFKETTALRQETRAFLTLAVGISFYLVFASFPKDEERLQKAIQWLNIGGLLLVFYTLPQAYYILTKATQYPKWIYITTDWFAKRTPYFFEVNRTSGLTYEPSWFGHQMILLFLPLWLSATIERTSSFRFRILGVSLENILLILGIFEFFLSAPRISLIGVLMIGIYLAARLHKSLVDKFSRLAIQRLKLRFPTQSPRLVRNITGLLLILLYAALVSGVFLFILRRDERMIYFFTYPPTWPEIQQILSFNEKSLLGLANRMAFFERSIYWFSGLHVFTQYPWFGVGLGNVGFFFLQSVPDFGWTSFEILKVLNESTFLPNTKSLFVRLLAETGLVGFSIFILFLYNTWRSARIIYAKRSPTFRQVAVFGQLALLAMIGEGFSIDSFAMPYVWVFTGLISAAAMIYRRQFTQAALTLPKEPEQSAQPHAHLHTD